ncbi:NACHT domain-containing NTPase [Streptomyces sp. CBMA152]|uniref:NACHT domain-containing protein n=1 Tax=Streptomyces sp. CBMA152 TaxID=1896312 RepID=UPI0016601BFE|nr:NACHT domain-containing protein [Streptomyces sp. CBMA152]MBD0742129.1 ATP-binding protein [Streptomyces sp. CBMA152]
MEPGLIGTKLASAVVTPLIRKLFVSEPPGAGLVDRPLRISSYVSFHGEKRTLDEADLRKLAHKLVTAALRSGERPIPADEEQAVTDALARTLHALGDLTQSDAEAVGLGPAVLARELRRAGDHPERHLSADATHFYERLLDTTCLHILNFFTQRSTFVASTLVHQTRRQSELIAKIDELIARNPSPDAADATFEQRYLAHLATKHGKLTIYGIDLTNTPRKWPLDAAYLSLEVTGRVAVRWHTAGSGKTAHYTYAPPQFAFEPRPAAQALADHERVLLRGEAGSGKTTLIQWLALSAAREHVDRHTAYLQDRIPFVLPLRTLTRHGERLPAPKDFLAAIGSPLAGEQPPGWEARVLKARRGIVLVDGIDEIPDAERAATRAWLGDLIEAYPGNRWLVTSRPSAVRDDWLADEEFTELTLCAMSPADVAAFIRRWHDAARTGAADDDAELTSYESQLLEAVRAKPDLGRLATNPLMCGLICALHRDRRGFLPYGRKDLYDAALSMLLIRRDRERDMRVPERRQEPQIQLLQQLAYWLIRNGRTEMDRSRAESVIADLLPSVRELAELGDASAVFEHFLHRSGLLREPAPGTVDFIHRTFQDYLGARAAVEAGDFGLLVAHSADDQWEDVVRMAVAHARPRERVELFTELIKYGDAAADPSVRTRVHLLAATCLEHAAELDPAVRAEVERRTTELIPPRSFEAARALAAAGPLILGLLPGPEGLDRETAELVVVAASHVASERAIPFLARFCGHPNTVVRAQLVWAWGRFETRQYADEVIARIDPEGVFFTVTSDEQLEALRALGTRPMLDARGDISPEALSAYAAEASLTRVRVMENVMLRDLSFLAGPHPLTDLRVEACPELTDLTGLSDKPLVEVRLAGIGHADYGPLATLNRVRSLSLDGAMALYPADLPSGRSLELLDASGVIADDLRGLAEGRTRLAGLYLGLLSSPRAEAEWMEPARMPGLRTLQVTGESLTRAPRGLSIPSVFQLYLVDGVPAAAFARLADMFPRLHVLNVDLEEMFYDIRQLTVPSTLLQVRFPVGTAAAEVFGLSQLPEGVDVFGISS